MAFSLQRFASSTYNVTFIDGSSVVLQCRYRADPDHPENYRLAHTILGDLIPRKEFLGQDEDNEGNPV